MQQNLSNDYIREKLKFSFKDCALLWGIMFAGFVN